MSTFQKFILFYGLAFLLSFLSLPLAQADNWDLRELEFRAFAQGEEVNGFFRDVRSSIIFDADDLANSRAEVIVTISSLSTPKATHQETLLGDDFFQVSTHKVARLVSQSFIKISDTRYALKAILTIRGISRPVTLPFGIKNNNTIVGHLNINRTWFGIGRGSWADEKKIGHMVQIIYELSEI